eukprot:2362102-Alexandrium_andersonii.AAC.1
MGQRGGGDGRTGSQSQNRKRRLAIAESLSQSRDRRIAIAYPQNRNRRIASGSCARACVRQR